MSTRTKVIITTVVLTIAAFALGPILWVPAATGDDGPGTLLPFFIVISFLEAIAFGLGVSLLLFGRKLVNTVKPDLKKAANILYVGLSWSLVSWWPHDNMHISNAHDDWGRLLLIEYLFHFTLLIAAVAMAWAFLQFVKKGK